MLWNYAYGYFFNLIHVYQMYDTTKETVHLKPQSYTYWTPSTKDGYDFYSWKKYDTSTLRIELIAPKNPDNYFLQK